MAVLKKVLTVVGVLVASHASAWDYPEHREIALQAVGSLDADHRQAFDELWQEVR